MKIKKIYFHINETEAWGYSEMANKETQIRGGGGSAYERGGDARRKFWIKLLKETYLGVAQAFLVS